MEANLKIDLQQITFFTGVPTSQRGSSPVLTDREFELYFENGLVWVLPRNIQGRGGLPRFYTAQGIEMIPKTEFIPKTAVYPVKKPVVKEKNIAA
jgi:hypothetical protein